MIRLGETVRLGLLAPSVPVIVIDGRQPARALWLLPLAEWFGFAAWIAGCGSSRVLWRGQLYDVQPHGRLVPVAQSLNRPVPVEP